MKLQSLLFYTLSNESNVKANGSLLVYINSVLIELCSINQAFISQRFKDFAH